MTTIPIYSAPTTKFTWFNNKIQVWLNPSYSFEASSSLYDNKFQRYILRLGKILICYTKKDPNNFGSFFVYLKYYY